MPQSKTWVSEALDLYRRGESYQKIADRFGLSCPTVWRALRSSGCKSRTRQRFNATLKEQGLRMYEAGFSYGDIAAYFGVTRQGAFYALKTAGCRSRPQLRFGDDNHFHRGGETQDDRAQNIAEKAILRGVLVPKPCEHCGANGQFSDGRREVQAHHCDYNKPLDVMWLCQRCHHEWHRYNRATPVRKSCGLP